MVKRRNLDEWIEIFKNVHGDKYDYSKLDLANKDEHGRVCIICPKHGEFWQTLDNHKKGKGCSKCNGGVKLTNEDFIREAKKVHGDRYKYDYVDYKGYNDNVKIICLEHGEFWQSWTNHIGNKQNCPKCSHRSYKYTKEEFTEKAKKIHGDKYDYSKVEYKNNKTEVCIICPKHGEIWQKPIYHLSGCGCKACKNSKLENEIYTFLIENKISFEYQKKFEWLGKQSLDFYLPRYNIAIECQGEQHYNDMYFSEKHRKDASLEYRIKLDTKKQKLCLENNVNVIYYSNKKYNDDIITDKDELLKEIKRYDI